jgi:hypothetical protein
MGGGGTTDSTYYKEIPLEEKWGPKSTLTLKRNNWIKAIQDAILQAKNANVEVNPVASVSSESNNAADVHSGNNQRWFYPDKTITTINRITDIILPNFMGNKSRS